MSRDLVTDIEVEGLEKEAGKFEAHTAEMLVADPNATPELDNWLAGDKSEDTEPGKYSQIWKDRSIISFLEYILFN